MGRAETLDIAVIGAGGAGLTAAIEARRADRTTALFEASSFIGGTFAYSTGLIWAPATSRALAQGFPDTPEEGAAHIDHLSAGRNDPVLTRAFAERVGPALDYLAGECGVPYEVVRTYPDYYAEAPSGRMEGRYLASPVFDTKTLPDEWADRLVRSPIYDRMPTSWPEVQSWGGFGTIARWDHDLLARRRAEGWVGFGTATVGWLLSSALSTGVDIRLESPLTGLRRQGDEWELTIGRGADVTPVLARSVVLATGAYDWNPRMQSWFDPYPPAAPAGMPSVDGEAILLALEAGASFSSLSGQILVPALSIPGETFNGQPLRRLFVREPAFPGSLVVNAEGRRFADESFYRDLVSGINHLDAKTQQYVNHRAWFVFDQAWKDKYWLGSVAPGVVPDWLVSADSALELAQTLGVDQDGFVQTLTRYNEHARTGEDPDFARGSTAYGRNNGDRDVEPNPCLRPLEGRLYAIQLELTTVGGRGGLRFDENARVLDWRDRPIPGLYAAGNAGAALIEGYWYNSGIANARAFTFGLAAARHAASVLERERTRDSVDA